MSIEIISFPFSLPENMSCLYNFGIPYAQMFHTITYMIGKYSDTCHISLGVIDFHRQVLASSLRWKQVKNFNLLQFCTHFKERETWLGNAYRGWKALITRGIGPFNYTFNSTVKRVIQFHASIHTEFLCFDRGLTTLSVNFQLVLNRHINLSRVFNSWFMINAKHLLR